MAFALAPVPLKSDPLDDAPLEVASFCVPLSVASRRAAGAVRALRSSAAPSEPPIGYSFDSSSARGVGGGIALKKLLFLIVHDLLDNSLLTL